MSIRSTLSELFRYNAWANDKLLSAADGLSDEELDRPFDMGLGTLRKTLSHIWSAEWIWLERWKQTPDLTFPPPHAPNTLAEIRASLVRTDGERAAFLDEFDDARFATQLTYRNLRGEQYSKSFHGMALHVVNHGIHHRAQASNMLRHLGKKLKRIDYIFMKLDCPAGPVVEWSLDVVRRYFKAGDAAFALVAQSAAGLPDELLDRPFEMGVGSLRDTFMHILDAERWWLDNWLHGPANLFPEITTRPSIPEMLESFAAHARQRDSYIAGLADSDLCRIVRVQGQKDVFREFMMAVSMLQMCAHGTHHRAQAINMIRRSGGAVPPTDLVLFTD